MASIFCSRAPQRFAASPSCFARAQWRSLRISPFPGPALSGRFQFLERETGIEPATNSLEGCDSTTELLPRRHFKGSAMLRCCTLTLCSHYSGAPRFTHSLAIPCSLPAIPFPLECVQRSSAARFVPQKSPAMQTSESADLLDHRLPEQNCRPL